MSARTVAARMTAFLVLLYAVFMVALLVDGIGLRTGLLPGEAPCGAHDRAGRARRRSSSRSRWP